MSSDPINPSHYKHLPAEAIDIIMAAIAKAPSNESACLHWQTLKYLLRCWEKKGIEDLRKAKWYLDRLVNEFDGLLAEASGANETPSDEPTANPQEMLPPSGCRWLKCGDRFIDGDKSVDRRGNIELISECMVGDVVQVEKLFVRKIEAGE